MVGHNQAKNDKNLINYIWVKLINTPNFMFANVISRFVVVTMLGNYKLNIVKVSKFIFYFIYISVKKKSNINIGIWPKNIYKIKYIKINTIKKNCKYNKDEYLSKS